MTPITTPIEQYNGIFVKREDMCFADPAPPFSKCRGIIKHLETLKKSGIKTVGYTETSISMAGWGIAWATHILGMKAVLFNPQYKNTPETLVFHRKQWAKFPNVEVIPLKAGMAKVNFYISKKILQDNYQNSVLLPLGLPFKETIEATKHELIKTIHFIKDKRIKTIICCVGSGTICSGILHGLHYSNTPVKLIGVMTRSGNKEMKEQAIFKKAGIVGNGFFKGEVDFELIDPGWDYTQKATAKCPFPCHEYYDLKSWEYLVKHRKYLQEPILFWNIGR